jgi:hypothetical protein
MKREVNIEQKVVDGRESLVITLDGATDEELGEIFEKLALQRDRLLPNGHMALGARIVEFYVDGWPKGATHEDYEEHLVDSETGDLSVEMTEMYDLRHFGQVIADSSNVQDFEPAFRAWEEMKYGDPRSKTKRYPYTFAADLVRMEGPHEGISPKLSRSDASQLVGVFAKALGIADVTVAEALADYYLNNDEEILAGAAKRAEQEWKT